MFTILLLGFLTVLNAKEFTVEVQGLFVCHTQHKYDPLHVELMEHDVVGDDLLAWSNVRPPYYWDLQGKEDEMFNIRPFLVIKHTCNGIKERVVVEFGRIRRNVFIDFGIHDLENPDFPKDMREMIKEQI
ncbi:hypothetical protein V3C99_017120 [Haemonchus contortus]|uniref:Transthyretin domain containing protein n=1 Tax=Haemonchus contortus TaxID=6289 RepID=A0A7I5EER3_HAECO|nr:unnamed protein product [Haemonchus contortus]